MNMAYYTMTEGTGAGHYDRHDYFNNTTNTTPTYIPWHISTQYIAGTYVTGQYTYDQYRVQRQESQPRQPQKTPEQLRAEAEAKKAEVEAKDRAKALLLEYLDNENKQRLLDDKPLEIASKLFNGIKYHIPISRIGKIEAFKENKVVTRLCLLVKETETLPIEDVVLTKLLHVLNDETNMLKTANHSSVQEDLLVGLN